MPKTIRISLTNESINNGIKEVERYKRWVLESMAWAPEHIPAKVTGIMKRAGVRAWSAQLW